MKTNFKKLNNAKRTVSDFSYGKKQIVFYNDAIKQDENIKHNLNHIIENDNPCLMNYSFEDTQISIEYLLGENNNIKKSSTDNNVLKFSDNYFEFERSFNCKKSKETILIKNRHDDYSLKYRITLNNLYLEIIKNHIVYKRISDNKTIFVMKSPFMYDKNKKISKEIEVNVLKQNDNVWELIINPNAGWINDKARKFPITIDPSIEIYEEDLYINQAYYNSSTGEWELDEYQTDYYYIDENSRLEIYVDLADLDYDPKGVKEAKLNFDSLNSGYFLINGHEVYLDQNNAIDIAEYVKQKENFVLIIEMDTQSSIISFQNIDEVIEIIYENINVLTKTIDLSNNVASINYLRSGENKILFKDIDLNDGLLSFSINHIFDKASNLSFGYGWKPNVYLNLNKLGNYYEYRDEFDGFDLLLKKYYIYCDNTKVIVNEDFVSLDDSFKMVTTYNSKKYEVFLEYVSDCGVKVITEIDDIYKAIFLEQRSEEQIKLENEIKSYENYFLNLVSVNREQENIQSFDYGYKKFNNLDDLLDYIEANKANKNVLFFNNLDVSSSSKWLSVPLSIRDLYSKNYNYSIDKLLEEIKIYKQDLIELERIYSEIPINYLIRSDLFYGFNKYGNLCQIFDKFQNYIQFIWENIYTQDGKKLVIKEIKSKNHQISFEYNYYNQLSSIFDNKGTIINYKYSGNLSTSELIEVKDNRGSITQFNYSNNRLSLIKENSGNIYSFSYTNNILTSISEYSCFAKIDGTTNYLTSDELLNKNINNCFQYKHIVFNRSSNKYTVLINNNFEEYRFANTDNELAIISGYNNVVENIEINKTVEEKYSISLKLKKNIDIVTGETEDSLINEKLGSFKIPLTGNLNTFTYSGARFELINTDDFNRIIKKETNWECISYTTNSHLYKKIIYQYEYNYKNTFDKYDKEIKKIFFSSTKSLDDSEIVTYITEYEYDGNALIKSENYSLDNLIEEGKDITEYEYDENGNTIKEISYNTKNATSKFYKEYKYDDKHQVIEEVGALGLSKIYNNYKNDKLISIKSPKNIIFGYAYDERGNIISINKSLADGEQNQTNLKYNLDYLTGAQNENLSVNYEYDFKGRTSKVILNDINYNLEYKGRNYEDSVVAQPNLNDVYQETLIKGNLRFDKFYDLKTENIKQINENNITIQKYDYNSKNLLVSASDYIRGFVKDFNYDELNRLDSINYRTNSTLLVNESYSYNSHGLLERKTFSQALNQNYLYYYKNNEMLNKINLPNGYDFYIDVDKNKRYLCTQVKFNNALKCNIKISYVGQGDHTSILPSYFIFNTYNDNEVLIKSEKEKYVYGENNFICEIHKDNTLKNKFKYDTLGRLIREDNVDFNRTYQYFYDNEGNILESKTFDLNFDETLINEISSNKYLYQNGKLIKFNDYEISYDDCGNPLTYKGNILKWRNKSLLSRYGNYAFSYDAEGTRVAKGTLLNPNNYNLDNLSVSESELNNATNFIYDNEGNLVKQINGNNIFEFIYDSTGLFGFKFNGTNYFYKKNLLNDIEEIINLSTNEVVAKYIYDAWGNHKVADDEGNTITDLNHIGNLNPFRYRSYYYDVETGLYWVNTRYYDSETKRFISIDSFNYLKTDVINGLNLYAYCGNDPVNYIDPNGQIPEWIMWLIGVTVILSLGIATLAAGGVAGGVAGFVFAGAFKGALIGGISSSIVNGFVDGVSYVVSGKNFWDGFSGGAAHGFMSGAIIGGITGAITSGVQVHNAAKLWANTGNKTGYGQMVKHYAKHVIDEGQKSLGKNIVNYSKQAANFFKSNYNKGYLLRAGVTKIEGYPGGIFNTNGLIRSYWYVPK